MSNFLFFHTSSLDILSGTRRTSRGRGTLLTDATMRADLLVFDD
jgi:hypothetical protein